MSAAFKDPAPYEQRQVVAHFHDATAFEDAVELLENKGFRRDVINMVARHDTVIKKLSQRYEAKASPDDAVAFPQAIYLDRHDVERTSDETKALDLMTRSGGENVHAQSITRHWDDDDDSPGNFDLNAYREWG
ncbi:hypothetical protein [uncultured Hoeflea sp.]|uniref:hypothetical protein n=1 Tax=uncultured Hoeflea sp. TaxID=538666 RepID=UPI0030D7FF70|tara:strand:- start:351 stop:749 length:399 start_codon:yes stop_codon:yes gene_type:complete